MQTTKRSRRSARELFRLCFANGTLDEARVRQVAQRLAGSKRRHGIAILSHFQRLVRLDRDAHTAVVQSAAPLDESLRDVVRAGLAQTYGPELQASFEENPELIAGMRIRIGSQVYDGSVRARLAALARQW
jgi:F-type H+-transporting ATPase subunit delta